MWPRCIPFLEWLHLPGMLSHGGQQRTILLLNEWSIDAHKLADHILFSRNRFINSPR